MRTLIATALAALTGSLVLALGGASLSAQEGETPEAGAQAPTAAPEPAASRPGEGTDGAAPTEGAPGAAPAGEGQGQPRPQPAARPPRRPVARRGAGARGGGGEGKPIGPEESAEDEMAKIRRLFIEIVRHMGRAEEGLGRASLPEGDEARKTIQRIRDENEKILAGLEELARSQPDKQSTGAASAKEGAPPEGAQPPPAGGAKGEQAAALGKIDELFKAIKEQQQQSAQRLQELIKVAEKMKAQQQQQQQQQQKEEQERQQKEDELQKMPNDEPHSPRRNPPPDQQPRRPEEKVKHRRDDSAWIATLPPKELEQLARAEREEALKQHQKATQKYFKDMSEKVPPEGGGD
ncbi:MAG: hypothetical protein HY719_12550 [Planctomycetes bacterium]|nr:hypothetical protein [Planctomycetota bacterium]